MSDAEAVEYAVPRHPAVPSPSFRDVIASEVVARDGDHVAADHVRVYRGTDIRPAASTLVDRGPLVRYEKGLLFIATGGHPEWRDDLRALARIATSLATGLALDLPVPMDGAIARVFQRTVAEDFLDEIRGRDPREAELKDLERRLSSTRALVFPYVDIVRVRSEWVWSWRRLRKVDATIVTLEAGTEDQRTYGVVGLDSDLASPAMRSRFELEFAHFTRVVWRELLDLPELWQSLSGGYADLSIVPVGRLWDDWKAAVPARMAARRVTLAQVASLALQRLDALLPHYRRIPPVVPILAAAEAVARGAAA